MSSSRVRYGSHAQSPCSGLHRTIKREREAKLTFKDLILLKLLLDVSELCGLPHVHAGLRLFELAQVHLPLLLLPLLLQ